MAFSAITARGSAVSNTSTTTIAVSPTANIVVDRILFVSITSDNIATVDGVSSNHSLSDSVGNTYNKVFEVTDSAGAASDGSTTSLWWTRISTQIGTANSITATFSSAISDKIISLVETTVGANKTVDFFTGRTSSDTNTTLSHTLSGLASREYLFLGLFGAEGEDTAKTPIANYVEQFDLTSTTAGVADVNVQQHIQTRILTGTGDTVTSSAVTFTNGIQSLTAFYEVDAPISVTVSASKLPSSTTFRQPTLTTVVSINVAILKVSITSRLNVPTITTVTPVSVEIVISKLITSTILKHPAITVDTTKTISKLSASTNLIQPSIKVDTSAIISKLIVSTSLINHLINIDSVKTVSILSNRTSLSTPTLNTIRAVSVTIQKLSNNSTLYQPQSQTQQNVNVNLNRLSLTSIIRQPFIQSVSNIDIQIQKLSSTTTLPSPTVSTGSVINVNITINKLSSSSTLGGVTVSGVRSINITPQKLADRTTLLNPTIQKGVSVLIQRLIIRSNLVHPTITTTKTTIVSASKLVSITSLHLPIVSFGVNDTKQLISRLQKTYTYNSKITKTFEGNSRLQDKYIKLSIPDEL